MKTVFFKIALITGLAISIVACNNPGKEGSDGHEDLEGAADPANTGGKLGGSQSPLDRKKDSTALFNLKLRDKDKAEQK